MIPDRYRMTGIEAHAWATKIEASGGYWAVALPLVYGATAMVEVRSRQRPFPLIATLRTVAEAKALPLPAAPDAELETHVYTHPDGHLYEKKKYRCANGCGESVWRKGRQCRSCGYRKASNTKFEKAAIQAYDAP